MILLFIFILIFFLSLNVLNHNLTSSLIRRLTAISFICAGVLIFNTFYIQSIGSGTGMYSGLFGVSVLSNGMSLFILIISSILLLIWPNISNILMSSKTNLSNTNKTELLEIKESYNLISNKNKSKQYCLIVLFNILGALFLVSSSDLISMYLSIELQSFGLYILATLYKEKLSSTSAGLKYFLLGALSSSVILLGSGLVYTYTGLTNLELIYTFLSVYSNSNLIDMNGISIGIFLIFSGFLFKIAAAPFHNWSIDVYDDSPTLVTAWLTVMPKLSILILLLQLLIGVDVYMNIVIQKIIDFLPFNILSNLLLLSSLLSLIIGAVVGLSQIKIKRLLAYSTINHVGFLLLSLSVFTSSSSNFSQSVESFIFYIIQYTLTNLNIFLIVLSLSYIINLRTQLNSSSNSSNYSKGEELNQEKKITAFINISDMEYINSFKGLFLKNPVLSLSLSICLFSFAGVPPLIGFFAKQQVLYSSNTAGYFFLSLIAILVSVISAFYYLKIIKIVFSMPRDSHLNNEKNKLILLNSSLSLDYATIKESNNRKLNITNDTDLIRQDQNTIISNTHSFLISILTVFIIIFIFNPELLLNSIAVINCFTLNL
jgi:NADH-ubiquinone oxidoreductase chain 2